MEIDNFFEINIQEFFENIMFYFAELSKIIEEKNENILNRVWPTDEEDLYKLKLAIHIEATSKQKFRESAHNSACVSKLIKTFIDIVYKERNLHMTEGMKDIYASCVKNIKIMDEEEKKYAAKVKDILRKVTELNENSGIKSNNSPIVKS